jgi:hypothetical protein
MTIPIFSFVWIAERYEHWLHSGSDALFRKFNSQTEFMIGKILERPSPGNGLYRLGPDKELWHFYEWAPGLSGEDSRDNESHAPYNMYFYEAHRAYAAMLCLDGRQQETEQYSEIAERLRQAINNAFWNGERYATKLIDGQLRESHEHTQFWALYPGRFASARGSIPTPSGFIDIDWRQTDNGLKITMRGPEGLRPEPLPLPEAPINSLTYNGLAIN